MVAVLHTNQLAENALPPRHSVATCFATARNELTEYIFNRFGQLDWEVGPNGVTKDNQYDDHRPTRPHRSIHG